ncbi:MAG: hypothetical protein GMKNLPBB_02403 [Myxococcota bacterium]|nr:hypothetical protein [Myxococcota bacterium]
MQFPSLQRNIRGTAAGSAVFHVLVMLLLAGCIEEKKGRNESPAPSDTTAGAAGDIGFSYRCFNWQSDAWCSYLMREDYTTRGTPLAIAVGAPFNLQAIRETSRGSVITGVVEPAASAPFERRANLGWIGLTPGRFSFVARFPGSRHSGVNMPDAGYGGGYTPMEDYLDLDFVIPTEVLVFASRMSETSPKTWALRDQKDAGDFPPVESVPASIRVGDTWLLRAAPGRNRRPLAGTDPAKWTISPPGRAELALDIHTAENFLRALTPGTIEITVQIRNVDARHVIAVTE